MNWENREAQYTPRGDVNTASLSSSENPGASCEVTGVFLKLHPMLCCPKLQTAAGSFPLLEKATCNWSSHHLFLMACKERNSCLGLSPPRATQQSFIRKGSAPRSNPLPFYIPLLTDTSSVYFPLTNGTPLTYLLDKSIKWLKQEAFLSFPCNV